MLVSKRKRLKKILICIRILNGRAMPLNQNLPLCLDINISKVKANGHGYRKSVGSSEQLPSCALG